MLRASPAAKGTKENEKEARTSAIVRATPVKVTLVEPRK